MIYNQKKVLEELEAMCPRSAWGKGVTLYAKELAENIEDGEVIDLNCLKRYLLNGADSWKHYSFSGCSLIYDTDIASRLCTPSEFKKTKGGVKPPNRNESWLNVQARALRQASFLIQIILNK